MPIEGRRVSTQSFIIAVGIGAAALAFWVDARFPRLAPQDQAFAFAHVLAAMGICSFLVRPALIGALSLDPLQARAAGVLLVCLTGLGYAFLAGVWLVRLTHASVARFRR